jgi:two-component system sensor histidine kinase BarA
MHQVLGVVAHEMRTPLAGLRAISEVLMTHRADSEQHLKFTRRMNEEVVRLSNTVNDLLESARQNSGHANWNWSTFAVTEIACQAMESIRPLVDEHGIALAIHVDAKNVEMNGDAAAIGRLILNLLSNAAKHTSRGSITLRVKRHTDSAGRQWIRLAVRDTGAGFLPEIIPHLGRPFTLNKGIVGTQSLGGSGVGLSLCRGIAEAHGGTLTLHSVPGRGTLATAQLRADLPESATTRCKIDLSISPLDSSFESPEGAPVEPHSDR